MLETLVSSKIRRALLEYILTHPTHRFYLRGLAKELGLTISPLRRELKRLEALGVLKAYQEANIRFYVVDQASLHFAQLKSAVATQPATIEPAPIPVPQPLHTPEPLMTSTVLSHANVERVRRALTPSISWPLLVGGLSVVGVMLVLGGMAWYLVTANQQLLSLTRQAVVAQHSQVTVVESVAPRPSDLPPALPTVVPAALPAVVPDALPAQSAMAQAGVQGGLPAEAVAKAGEMQSTRWRLMPGTMGGFNAGAAEGTY